MNSSNFELNLMILAKPNFTFFCCRKSEFKIFRQKTNFTACSRCNLGLFTSLASIFKLSQGNPELQINAPVQKRSFFRYFLVPISKRSFEAKLETNPKMHTPIYRIKSCDNVLQSSVISCLKSLKTFYRNAQFNGEF